MQSPLPESTSFDPNIDPQLYSFDRPPGTEADSGGASEDAEQFRDEMDELLLILGPTQANIVQILSHTNSLGQDSRDSLYNFAMMGVKDSSIAPLLAFATTLANSEALKDIRTQQDTMIQTLNTIRANQLAAVRVEKADKDQIRAVCKATVGDHSRIAFDQESLGQACSQIFKAQLDTNGLARFFGQNINLVTRREFAKQVNISHSEAKSTVRTLLQEALAKQLNISTTTCKIVKALLGSEMHVRTGHYLNVIVFFDIIFKNPTLVSKGVRIVGRPPAKRPRTDTDNAPSVGEQQNETAREQNEPAREDDLTERFFGAVDKFFAEKIVLGWGKDKKSYEWCQYFMTRFDHELKRDPRDEGLRKIKDTLQSMHMPLTSQPSNVVPPPSMLGPAAGPIAPALLTAPGERSTSGRPNGSMNLRNLLLS